jgi:hypothetical protein
MSIPHKPLAASSAERLVLVLVVVGYVDCRPCVGVVPEDLGEYPHLKPPVPGILLTHARSVVMQNSPASGYLKLSRKEKIVSATLL